MFLTGPARCLRPATGTRRSALSASTCPTAPTFRMRCAPALGRFYGIGTTSGEPGYYLRQGDRRDGGSVLGVATVKVSLDKLQSPWRREPDPGGDGRRQRRRGHPRQRAGLEVPDARAPAHGDLWTASRPPGNSRACRSTPLGIRTERVLDDGVRIISLPYGDAGGPPPLPAARADAPPFGLADDHPVRPRGPRQP